MPNTNITKEELKNKDEKKLVKDSDGRVVDILDLLDNPDSLDPNIRRRITVLQKYAKISNQTIAERYGEKTTNLEDLDSVNENLLAVCKVLAIEESKKPNGVVIDENGNYNRVESVKKAMANGLSDMYDITADKISQNTSKYGNVANRENDKLLENIFKEVEEKQNFKFSKNAEDLFKSSLGESNFFGNFGGDVNAIKNSNLENGTKSDIEKAMKIINEKNNQPESLYEGALSVYYVGRKMAKLKEIDISSLSEEEKKEFLTEALGICNAPTSDDFLQDLDDMLNKMYSGLSIIDAEKIANILNISEDEVMQLQAGKAAQRFSKRYMDFAIKDAKELDMEFENLVTKEYEILYSDPNADKSKLDKLKNAHPEFAEEFLKIEKKDFSDSKTLIELQYYKEVTNKNALNVMMDQLENSLDGLNKNNKRMFIRQAVSTIGGGGADEQVLDRIQTSLEKLNDGKTVNIEEPGEFVQQITEILNKGEKEEDKISTDEIWMLISGKGADKNFEDSINYLKKYNRYKREQIPIKTTPEKIADTEINDYYEAKGEPLGESTQQDKTPEDRPAEQPILEVKTIESTPQHTENVVKNKETQQKTKDGKSDEELTNEDILPTDIESNELQAEEKTGFFSTIIAKVKSAFNRITGKQKLLSEGNTPVEDINTNSNANPRDYNPQKDSNYKDNNFIPKATVNEKVALDKINKDGMNGTSIAKSESDREVV